MPKGLYWNRTRSPSLWPAVQTEWQAEACALSSQHVRRRKISYWISCRATRSVTHGHGGACYEHLVSKVKMVAIGMALQPFPRSKRSGHVSAHSAFRLGLWTPKGRIRHAAERCTSPSRPSSAFLSISVDFHFDRLTLAVLHRVLAMTARCWATTPPPPSVPYASIFASHQGGSNGFGVPQFQRRS